MRKKHVDIAVAIPRPAIEFVYGDEDERNKRYLDKEAVIAEVWKKFPIGSVVRPGNDYTNILYAVYSPDGATPVATYPSFWLGAATLLWTGEQPGRAGWLTTDGIKITLKLLGELAYNDPNAIRFEGE